MGMKYSQVRSLRISQEQEHLLDKAAKKYKQPKTNLIRDGFFQWLKALEDSQEKPAA